MILFIIYFRNLNWLECTKIAEVRSGLNQLHIPQLIYYFIYIQFLIIL